MLSTAELSGHTFIQPHTCRTLFQRLHRLLAASHLLPSPLKLCEGENSAGMTNKLLLSKLGPFCASPLPSSVTFGISFKHKDAVLSCKSPCETLCLTCLTHGTT